MFHQHLDRKKNIKRRAITSNKSTVLKNGLKSLIFHLVTYLCPQWYMMYFRAKTSQKVFWHENSNETFQADFQKL